MCGHDGPGGGGGTVLSRRALLAGTAAVAGAALVPGWRTSAAAGAAVGTVDLGGVAVLPREAWAAGLSPVGPIAAEPDVRYLLVHHSVDPGNDYGEGDVPGILRQFFRFHTSPAKGWPDIAYNFLVDRFGRVWEGRAGSLAAPVAGDATGGNQGFDQLCCFVGDHQVGAPTAEAFAAMGDLLGALARRHAIPLATGATATFTSRGSDRHPAGTVVTTATVAGHRDMSRTQCPGDEVFARLADLRLLAAGGTGPSPAAPPPAAPAPSATTDASLDEPSSPTTARPAATATSDVAAEPSSPPTAGPATTATSTPPTTRAATAPTVAAGKAPPRAAGGSGGTAVGPLGVAAGVAVVAAAGAAAVAGRRHRATPPPPPPAAPPS